MTNTPLQVRQKHNDNELSIILIDDDENTNLYHSTCLQEKFPGATIHCFDEARVVLKEARLGRLPVYSIIYTDKQMPQMSGWQFINDYEPIYNQYLYLPQVCLLSDQLRPKDYQQSLLYNCMIGAYAKSTAVTYLICYHNSI